MVFGNKGGVWVVLYKIHFFVNSCQKGTNILISYFFEYGAEYGAECSA